MLDDLIAVWVEAQARGHDRKVALRLQRIARVVVVPAASLMLSGLVGFALTAASTADPAQAVVPLAELISRVAFTPIGAMSIGLLILALLPMVNVLYILADRIATKRVIDAVAAAYVAAILILGIFLGRK